MLLALLVSLFCSVYYYVEAFKHGLVAKHWAWAGLFFGPLVLPLFSINKHIAMRRASGFGNVRIRA